MVIHEEEYFLYQTSQKYTKHKDYSKKVRDDIEREPGSGSAKGGGANMQK